MKSYSVILLLISYLLSASNLLSQIPDSITLTYSTYFAFEDAIGNVDTVFIHGKNTGSNFTNPGYVGEDLKDIPYDDVFEARLGDGSTTYENSVNTESSKSISSYARYITPCSLGGTCLGSPWGGGINLLVKADHWPVKISWPDTIFTPGGLWGTFSGSVLVDNGAHEGGSATWWLDSPFNTHQYACLNGFNSWNFQYIDDLFHLANHHLLIHPEGQPDLVDTVSRFSIWWSFDDPLRDSCIARALTPVRDYDNSPAADLSNQVTAYPNPVGGAGLQLELHAFAGARRLYLNAYNAAGVEMGRWSYFDQDLGAPLPLDTENWPPGLHYLLVVDEKGRHARVKVVRH